MSDYHMTEIDGDVDEEATNELYSIENVEDQKRTERVGQGIELLYGDSE